MTWVLRGIAALALAVVIAQGGAILIHDVLASMPTPSPEASPTPMPTPVDEEPPYIILVEPPAEPTPAPSPDIVIVLPSLPPIPDIPAPPPLPVPTCDRAAFGEHLGWPQSDRQCRGPNPQPR